MFPFFSRMFPSTNLQDLNLDWICRRIMELSKGIIAPWINPENQDWMVYDTETEQFVDSGVSAAGGGYVKPDTGIPESDLSADVQSSLDKADTALQAVPDTYRTAAAQDVIDNALSAAINAITPLDTAPTDGNTKGITSDAVYEALKLDPYNKASYLATGAYVEISKVNPSDPTQTLVVFVSPTSGGNAGMYFAAINNAGAVFLSTLVALTNGVVVSTDSNSLKFQSAAGIGACYVDVLCFGRSIPVQIYRSDNGQTT